MRILFFSFLFYSFLETGCVGKANKIERKRGRRRRGTQCGSAVLRTTTGICFKIWFALIKEVETFACKAVFLFNFLRNKVIILLLIACVQGEKQIGEVRNTRGSDARRSRREAAVR